MLHNSDISEESCFTSSRKRMTSNSVKSRHLLSVIYDDYQHDKEGYSRLLQSACITSKNIFVEDDSYAFLQTECMNEMKLDPITRKHRSLPSVSTIQNSIFLRS